MARPRSAGRFVRKASMSTWLLGPQMMAFVPAVSLGAFWLAGEWALVIAALGLPLLFLISGALADARAARLQEVDPVTGLVIGARLPEIADEIIQACAQTGRSSALFVLQLEHFDTVLQRHGQEAANTLLERVAQRFCTTLREGDDVFWLGNARFAILLSAETHFELESAVQLAARLQSAAEEPVSINLQAVFVSCSIGFCLTRRAAPQDAQTLIQSAQTALTEAQRNGPSTIRAYSREMGELTAARAGLLRDAATGLARGEIIPWFQPQVSTDTGEISGFEALARWDHPERGIIFPADFLPALSEAGLLERLGETILAGALQALKQWDIAGAMVPCVSVNFTSEELRNPQLAERIKWDLDRFDLSPDRLTIEVMETIVAGSPEDAAARNLVKLAELGCRIDLDDFGTGHASITAIRRFAIDRIKIDRSFITGVDKDIEQRRMVTAIQTMAERLGLETLAEGVETASEHSMLAQLGCAHVQGYGLGRPMPFEHSLRWLEEHREQLGAPPQITKRIE